MTENPVEVELKLQTTDERVLDRVWALERLGPFVVASRFHHSLHNVYLDSPDRALDRAGGNLRWRTIRGAADAELTYKGPSVVHDGVFRREELTVVLPARVDPLGVIPPPRPLVIAHQLTTELAVTELVLECDRRGMRLVSRDASVELALDITTMPGREYFDLEIEAELVQGDPAVLAELEARIAELGPVTRAAKGKRARGWAYLRRQARQ